MRSFEDTFYVDYSGLREINGTLTRDEYVAQRITALAALVMQHDVSNLRFQREDHEKVVVLCNFVIGWFPTRHDVNDWFHSYGRCRFAVIYKTYGWRIAGIVQAIMRNQGNPRLHGGVTENRKLLDEEVVSLAAVV